MYGLAGGFGIGLPPVLHFGSEELQKRVVGPCLRGEKRICLAITEVSLVFGLLSSLLFNSFSNFVRKLIVVS